MSNLLKRKSRDSQRCHRYERLLRHIRVRTYEYEDAGKLEKAQRVIAKIKRVCGAAWERRAKRLENKMLERQIQ
jgi:hypothetical protein